MNKPLISNIDYGAGDKLNLQSGLFSLQKFEDRFS